MALNVKTIETAPFEWAWEKHPDVKVVIRPLTPDIERAASRASGFRVNAAGEFAPEALVELVVVKAHAVIESWEGVELDGEPVTNPTRDQVRAVAMSRNASGLIADIVDAAEAKYAELEDLAGKSEPQSIGGSSSESTATDKTSSENSVPRAVSMADAG